MKKSKIAIILMSLVAVITIVFGLSFTANAAVNYGFFDKDDIDPDSYAYSMAVIGDTQSLVYSDVQNAGVSGYQPRLTKVYDWLVANKDTRKIEMVIGLGDITETWDAVGKPDDFKAEWELAVSQISKLNGNIPYTLVRGNHDTESGFNAYIGGMKEYTDQFTGDNGAFMTEGSFGTSYRKFQISGTKWIIITLDWAPTGAELDWAADLIRANPDYSVIVTMHDYLHNDMTVDGEGDSADTAKHNPNWDYSIDPTSPDNDPELVYNPDGIWERLISKHSNIKLVLSGHRPNGNIVYSQLLGDNGNTVTQMLVDPQSMDLDVNNEGGCGMVCMLYFREDGSLADTSEWDGSTVDVEWYSTIKDQYHKDENQFTIDLDLYDGGVATEKYGVIPAKYLDAEKYPFVTFGYDDDIDEFFFHSAHANWTTSEVEGAYLSVARFSAKDVPAYILLRRDFNAAEAGDTRYKNFGNMSVTLNLDLGGHTFTSSVYVFDANLKKASTSTINVYGDEGSEFLVGGSVPLFWLGTNQVAADGACFTYNFDGIRFGFADSANASTMLMATFSCAGEDAYSTTQNFNFKDCTFDLTNKPSKAIKLIQLDETVGSGYYVQKTNVNVNGGSFVANGTSDFTLYSANATDSVLFGEGVTFRLPSSYDAGATVYTDTNGVSYGLSATETVDSKTVYDLVPTDTGSVITKYGVIPSEYSDATAYPFVVFDQKGKFFGAYAKWDAFLAAGSKILTSSNKKATLLVRRDYATSENTSSSQNWYTFSGSILIDLDDHKITIDAKSHLFQFINKCSKDTTTDITLINGTIVTYQNYTPFIINGHTNSKADYTVNLTCNGVTFNYHKSSTVKKLLLDTFATGTTESNLNAVFNDCTFDISQAPHAVTLFNAKESSGTVKASNIVINGGVLKAPNFSYINFANLGTSDTLVFGQNTNGEYLTIQMPAGETATPSTTYDGANGIVLGLHKLSENATSVKYQLAPFSIFGAYLNITENINVCYSAVLPVGYTDPYMVFEFRGETYTVTNPDGSNIFKFMGVTPQFIGENIKATLYATYNGETVCVEKAMYSVKEYCVNTLKNTTDAKLITLLSDLLVYGAASQTYTGETGALVTDGLELTPSEFVAPTKNDKKLVGEADASVVWKGVALRYENAMAMKFSFTASADYTLEITVNGKKSVYNVSDLTKEGDNYVVYFRGIEATEYAMVVTATFYNAEGTQVGQSAQYSVNSYVYTMQNSTNNALAELVKATYNYGASAVAYNK